MALGFPSPHDHVLPENIRLKSPPVQSSDEKMNRIIGSLVGLATGDALGASSEFRPHLYFVNNKVQDMVGGGTWGLKAGQWTDDTSMALCLAASLITRTCFDPYDQMVRYKWWYKHGYLSSTGNCFDIGNATRDSIEKFISRQRDFNQRYHYDENTLDRLSWNDIQSKGSFDINCSTVGVAGNGALMRLAPVPLFFYRYPQLAVEYAGQSGRITHGDKKSVDACRYYAALIVAAVHGKSKTELLDRIFYENHRAWFGSEELHRDILDIARGSYQVSNGYDGGIRGKGYVVDALKAALWAFWSSDTFEKGALNAVNLGDDTDTTAAIYGQLAGAFYKHEGIPEKWRNKVYAHQLLVRMGEWLCYLGTEYRVSREEQKIITSGQSAQTNVWNNIQSNYAQPNNAYSPTTYQTSNAQVPRYHSNNDQNIDDHYRQLLDSGNASYSGTKQDNPSHPRRSNHHTEIYPSTSTNYNPQLSAYEQSGNNPRTSDFILRYPISSVNNPNVSGLRGYDNYNSPSSTISPTRPSYSNQNQFNNNDPYRTDYNNSSFDYTQGGYNQPRSTTIHRSQKLIPIHSLPASRITFHYDPYQSTSSTSQPTYRYYPSYK